MSEEFLKLFDTQGIINGQSKRLHAFTEQEQGFLKMLNLEYFLRCVCCSGVPKAGPIHQCADGHLMCRRCYEVFQNSCYMCRALNKTQQNLQRNVLAEQILSKLNPNFICFPYKSFFTLDVVWRGQLQMKLPQQQQQQQDTINQFRNDSSISILISRMKDGNKDVPIQNINWGTALRMQKIPKSIVKRIGSIYFQNCRKLFLFPKTNDDLQTLSKTLDPTKNAVGFVHIPDPANSFKCFIIINCGEKQAPVQFLGLIPDQDELFIQVLKVILREAKNQIENRVERSSSSEAEGPASKKQRQEACCTNNPTAPRSNDSATNDRGSDKALELWQGKFLEVQVNKGKANRLPFSIDRLLE